MSEEKPVEAKKETKKVDPPSKRKIIQIETSSKPTGQIIVTALCDDGTIWYRSLIQDYGDWVQVKPIT